MGFFKKLMGNDSDKKQEEKVLPWVFLTDVAQLAEIKKKSFLKPQIIFKHSTRCGISTMVLNQFISAYELNLDFDLYYLDVLSYRGISNEVGYKFQVIHESPQLLVIKNGVVITHASHGAINSIDLISHFS